MYLGEVLSVDDGKGEIQTTSQSLGRSGQLEKGAEVTVTTNKTHIPLLLTVDKVLQNDNIN